MTDTQSDIVIYQSADNTISLEVLSEPDTVWLTQAQMAELFFTTKQNIGIHVGNILRDEELKRNTVVKDFFITASDGKRYKTMHYNLDMILAVGYRVKSGIATQFRIWATDVLKQYLVTGAAINQKRLDRRTESTAYRKQCTRCNYFDDSAEQA